MALKRITVCIASDHILLIEFNDDESITFKCLYSEFEKIESIINFNRARCSILILPSFFNQKTITECLPYASRKNVKQLIAKVKMKNRSLNYEISECFLIAKNQNYLYYSFIFLNLNKEITKFITAIKDNLNGIYCSNLEVNHLLSNLSKNPFEKLLVLYTYPDEILTINGNKYGVEQSITRKKVEHTTLRSIAGDFIQIIEDIIIENKFHLDVFIVIPEQIKVIVTNYYKKIQLSKVVLLTPYEAAILLKIDRVVEEQEYFADILFAFKLIRGEKSYKCIPNFCRDYFCIAKYNRIANYSLYFLLILLTAGATFFELKIHSDSGNYNISNSHVEILSKELKNFEDQLQNRDLKYQEKINLYRLFYNTEDSTAKHVKNVQNLIEIEQLDINQNCMNVVDAKKSDAMTLKALGSPKISTELIQQELQRNYSDHQVICKKNDNHSIQINITAMRNESSDC